MNLQLKMNRNQVLLTVILVAISFLAGMEFKAYQVRSAIQESLGSMAKTFNTTPVTPLAINQPDTKPVGDIKKPDALKIGSGTTIDGIKITPTEVVMTKLEPQKDSFMKAPDETFLVVKVTLENTTPSQIIHLQSVWSKTTLTDNFGNNYSAITDYDYQNMQDLIMSEDLQPGEKTVANMVFQAPLGTATSFTVASNPAFYKSLGNNELKDLSEQSFSFAFGKEEVK